MSRDDIYFIYDANKEPDASFAQGLIDKLGQAESDKANVIVPVGGDGLLLRALRLFPGHAVCGVVPPGSNSAGFWTSRGIADADDLVRVLKDTPRYPIKPLRADIHFADGSSVERFAYNEVCIRNVWQALSEEKRQEFGLSEIDVSVQSALLELTVAFNDRAVLNPKAVMNDLILATAFGSTAVNRKYGGPSQDIRDEAIILTQMGALTVPSTVNGAHAVFDIDVQSAEKRPVIVTFDSFGVRASQQGSPVSHVRVSIDHERATQLIVTGDPGARAYSAMMP